MFKKLFKTISGIVTVFSAMFFISCSSTDIQRDMSARERFTLSLEQFKDGSYDKALENLKVISYDRSTSFADSVQYYLAECYFMREQYIIAGAEYRDLIRFHSNSPLLPEARYKVALSYLKLTPKSAQDPNYIYKAITEFQSFIEYYPTSPLVREAEKNIIELRNRLAKREYEIAVLYQKNEHYKSALVYYQGILEKYHDSEYADLAAFGIIEIYMAQKKINNAKLEIEKFLQKFINSSKMEDVLKIKKNIENL